MCIESTVVLFELSTDFNVLNFMLSATNGTIGQVGGVLQMIQKGWGRAVSVGVILTPNLLSACFFTLLFC